MLKEMKDIEIEKEEENHFIELENEEEEQIFYTNVRRDSLTSLSNQDMMGMNISRHSGNSSEKKDDDDKNGDGDDLLEPFPERNYPEIDHDRRPIEADVDGDDPDDFVLRPGDHVYVWKSFGMLGMQSYQKHGIVLSIDPDDHTNIFIVTFYHKNPKFTEKRNLFQTSFRKSGYRDDPVDTQKKESLIDRSTDENDGHSSSSTLNPGEINKDARFVATVRTESLYTFQQGSRGRIRKVKYNANLAKRLLSRGGTVTSCSADETPLVLARVKYLLETPGRLPEFHLMGANGECAAAWCKLGRWCTLQGSSILHILFVGQAGGAAVGGVVASNVFVWTSMPGFWGSVGYIWFVPATVAYPLLVPILIGFGLASLVPLEALRRFRKKWAQITSEMNKAFWANTDEDIRDCYFASTISADDDWTQQFFGEKSHEDKNEKEKGKYMPLGGGGQKSDGTFVFDNDSSDDELDDKMASEYGYNKSQSDFEKEWKLDQQKSDSAKEKWNSIVQNMSKPFRKEEKEDSIFIPKEGDDAIKPLNDDTSYREVL